MGGRFLDAPVSSRGELEGVKGAVATDAAESAFTRIPADHPRALPHMGAAVGADAPMPKVEKVSHLGRCHDRAPPAGAFSVTPVHPRLCYPGSGPEPQ